jgi:hypothetical protein
MAIRHQHGYGCSSLSLVEYPYVAVDRQASVLVGDHELRTFQGNTNYCRNATFSDLGELDDRGYIYNMDRAGSGLTILQFTGDALDVVTGHGEREDRDEHRGRE